MTDESPVDLAAYFERIGYEGPTEPTAGTLAELQRSHLAYIPFESLDPFLHRDVSIAPEDVDAKLIAGRRGGMCFEHSALFRRVLLTLGYEVTSLTGRGMWGTVRPRAHHAMRVRAEGEDWLVEVGNGASTPTAPLQWRYDVEQQTPHGLFRLLREGAETVLQEKKLEGWVSSYCLSHDPQLPMDFEPGNWWTTAHPTSFYRAYLTCTLAPADVRVLLFNNRLTVRRPGAPDEKHILDADGLGRCLGDVFGMPVDPLWRPHLQRAVELGEAA
jgi:N-hydroxyarylamine O-acetyltransferase